MNQVLNWNLLLFLFALSIPLLMGCSGKTFNTEKDYLKWINDDSNGLVKIKKVNGFTIKARYLPPDYLAYNEIKNHDAFHNKEVFDSLKSQYSNTRTFLITIAPDENKREKTDVMYYGVHNEQDYKARVQELNFDVASSIKIETNSNEYAPALHSFENTYSISDHRNIYLVFAEESGDLLSSENLTLVYTDEIFDTGISYFNFDRQNLDKIYSFNFSKF